MTEEMMLDRLRTAGPQSTVKLREHFGLSKRPIYLMVATLLESKTLYIDHFTPPAGVGRWAAHYAIRVTGKEVNAIEPPRRGGRSKGASMPVTKDDEDGVERKLPVRRITAKGLRGDHVAQGRATAHLGPWAGL